MASYSVTQAQLHLSDLIDEALAGHDVTITRDGKTLVTLTAAQTSPVTPDIVVSKRSNLAMLERLKEHRDSLPRYNGDVVADIRAMRDET